MRCQSCGQQLEEDYEGMPPAWAREALLARNGTWRIVLAQDADRLRAAAALRALLGLGLKETTGLARSKSSTLWSGTQVECMWLAKHLRALGIETVVEKLQDPK